MDLDTLRDRTLRLATRYHDPDDYEERTKTLHRGYEADAGAVVNLRLSFYVFLNLHKLSQVIDPGIRAWLVEG